MADETVSIRFDGTASGLLAAAHQVSNALHGVQGQTQQMSKTTMAAGVAMGTAFAMIAQKALHFAKDAFGAFNTVAGEVRKMQGILGGTAEDMSRLRFAGYEVGVSSQVLIKSMSLLSAHIKTNDDKWKQLGIAATDANGQLKPSIQLIGEVADKLNGMGKGLERTATAKELFGRGFATLNPLLARGSEGIAKFAEEADKMGLTLSQKDVQGAKAFKEATMAMKASIEGAEVAVGRALTPTLTFLAGVITEVVMGIRNFLNSTSLLGTIVRDAGIAVAFLVGMIVEYMAISKIVGILATVWEAVAVAIGISTVATEGATAAQWSLNAAMDANPVGVVILGIQLLVAALFILVKKFEPVGTAITWLFKMMGMVAGKGIAIVVKYLEFLGIGYINLARIAVKAGEIITGNRFWKAIFGGGANKSVKGALDAMDAFEAKFKSIADGIASTAWNKGGDIGEKLGAGIVNGIKNFKLPSFKAPDLKGNITPDPFTPTEDTSAKDKAEAAEKARLLKLENDTKDYWEKRINMAKDAFDVAKGYADKAKEDMAQIAKDVTNSITSGFDITALTASSFAKYLGADALVASFRKKLADAKEFVSDLRLLKNQGLPVEMLQQIAAAGVEGGLDTARLLVGNTGAIEELKGLQVELNTASADAGEIVSTAVMGQTVTSTAGVQAEKRAELTNEERGAGAAGVVVNETQNASGGINITVQTATNASPSDIADAIAFSIVTNTPAVTPTASFDDFSGVDFSGIDLSGFSVGGLATFV